MLGFSNLLKSNFGDSATTLTSPIEPRLKNGQDADTAPPESFDTPVGERRVPREKDPRKPSFDMIKAARKGILSGFLRSGKIFCASDFVGIVNPKTAIITLHDIYDFETRGLAVIDDQPIPRPPLSSRVPFNRVADKEVDDEKQLRNLYFITLADDELPSFHFWRKPGDSDPVTAGRLIDWGKHFDENPPTPAITARIAMLENERKEKAQRGAEEQQNTQNKQSLGVLDHYNDNSSSALGGEPVQGQTANNIDTVSLTSARTATAQKAEVLLQFNRGGMYLREFTHTGFYAMACWLVENEEEEEEEEEEKEPQKDLTEIKDMYLDILGPGNDLREEKIVSVSRVSYRNFQQNIRPIFDQPDRYFRIRSTRFSSSWNIGTNFDSAGEGDLMYDLKLVRPNVGYCYCSAHWQVTGSLRSNSQLFEKALKFLFDWGSAYPKSDHYSLDIPGHGSFDLNRSSDVVVDAKIQKIFAELSVTQVKSNSHPAEITVRDVVEDVTDGSDFLGTISPRHGNAKHETDPGEVPDGLQTTAVHGGPDLPLIHPRLLTNSEIKTLQERLKILEASVIDTDDLQERLRIAEEELAEMNGLQERLKTSENRARLKFSCPFCSQDWAGATKQQQQDHLKLHRKDIVHQPATQKCPQPDCTNWLGEHQNESTYEAILEHLRAHIEEEHAEDGICEHQNCHANMYAMTGEQQEQHESVHRDSQESQDERDRLEKKFKSLEDLVKERDQLQEKVSTIEKTATEELDRHIQDDAVEKNLLKKDIVDITEKRDSLQDRVVELERQLNAASRVDKCKNTNGPEPETELGEDAKQPSQLEAPKKLRYCNVCLKSVDKMSANAKTKHADKCETSVSEYLLLTPAEAKAERERRNTSRDVIRPQVQERTEEETEAPQTRKKKKQSASANAARSESQQEEAEDANTIQQPGSGKATGRKTPKRKFDNFKPLREDQSDEDLESPKKKPKLKAKAATADTKGIAPTRRSTRGKNIYEPPEKEDDEDKNGKEADDKPSSSANGGKRKKRAAAVTTVLKKTKSKE